MLIKIKKSWEMPERLATPEHVYMNRRKFMGGVAAAGAALAASPALAQTIQIADPETNPYPAERNPDFTLDRALTDEEVATTYNNFYEFGSHKRIWRAAQALETRPWQVTIDGMVEEERTIDIDELIRAMPIEERLYRHRCVEAWAMAVPWTGFALRELVNYARPLPSARYLRMETFLDPDTARGQRAPGYPFPYVEGLTMAEATNDLAFMVIGIYGRPAPPQNGAPLRLATPWKYGFKSIKSIVRFTFTDQRPRTFWNEVGPSEYGFWANVNPEVPHRRWSQANERLIGTDEEVPTQLFNGYAEQIGDLYANIEGEDLWH